MIPLVLLSCLISSYYLGFDGPNKSFYDVTHTVETFFYIDFALNFITATKHPITMIETNTLFKIINNYIFGCFLRDFIALIPFESFIKD